MGYPIIYTGKHTAKLRLEEMAGRLKDPPMDWRVWRFRLDIRNIVTPAAATSQVLNLTSTAAVTNAKSFPTNVWIEGAWGFAVEDVAGGTISAATAQLGDAADPNGLITAQGIFTGAATYVLRTPAAAEFAFHPELGQYVPQFTLTLTGDNVTAAETGIVDLYIKYAKLHPAMF